MVRRAQRGPLVRENRGAHVVVVVGLDEHQRSAEQQARAAAWRGFLERTAAMVTETGGVDLELTPRGPRSESVRGAQVRAWLVSRDQVTPSVISVEELVFAIESAPAARRQRLTRWLAELLDRLATIAEVTAAIARTAPKLRARRTRRGSAR